MRVDSLIRRGLFWCAGVPGSCVCGGGAALRLPPEGNAAGLEPALPAGGPCVCGLAGLFWGVQVRPEACWNMRMQGFASVGISIEHNHYQSKLRRGPVLVDTELPKREWNAHCTQW